MNLLVEFDLPLSTNIIFTGDTYADRWCQTQIDHWSKSNLLAWGIRLFREVLYDTPLRFWNNSHISYGHMKVAFCLIFLPHDSLFPCWILSVINRRILLWIKPTLSWALTRCQMQFRNSRKKSWLCLQLICRLSLNPIASFAEHCWMLMSHACISSAWCWRHNSPIYAKLSQHRFWHSHENSLIKMIQTIPHNLYVSVKSASLHCGLG